AALPGPGPGHDGNMTESLPLPPHLVTAVDHVGLAVADRDPAIGVSPDPFGFETVHVETTPDQGVREAMVRVGPEDGGTMLQLLAPLDETSTIAAFLERHGPGLQQLAYRV